ncbi:hypothetical protein IFM89_026222 [Coptis chinensis]|uniref:Uncharacterized protein n=1 Tax=Coptis chinensis TaxID=261450 RepID=A0A835IDT7_9MAGN|nr:hypothetical protein IFM89_026222 [Coptis chinensis]
MTALGNLASLENLLIDGMSSVKHIGMSFMGLALLAAVVLRLAFPKLKKLEFKSMERGKSGNSQFQCTPVPYLRELELFDCPVLRALPGLGRLGSLQHVVIDNLSSVVRVGFEILGIDDDDDDDDGFRKGNCGGESIQNEGIIFPNIRGLTALVELPTLGNLCISLWHLVKGLTLVLWGIAEKEKKHTREETCNFPEVD